MRESNKNVYLIVHGAATVSYTHLSEYIPGILLAHAKPGKYVQSVESR